MSMDNNTKILLKDTALQYVEETLDLPARSGEGFWVRFAFGYVDCPF